MIQGLRIKERSRKRCLQPEHCAATLYVLVEATVLFENLVLVLPFCFTRLACLNIRAANAVLDMRDTIQRGRFDLCFDFGCNSSPDESPYDADGGRFSMGEDGTCI